MTDTVDEMLRDAMVADPPCGADAQILATIRSAAAVRRRSFTWQWIAAAASVAILLGGMLYYGRLRETSIQEDGELMLEITGMASMEDFYSPRMVAL